MKLSPPENENYSATIVQVNALLPLDNCDNVVAAPLLGYHAIVSKDTKVGDVGILFTAETQLSDDYCRANNLYRESELNADPSVKGYLEKNRRVKALKFRGHRSDALFMPLTSLAYLQNFDPSDFNVGDKFDKLGDNEICRKYVVKEKGVALAVNKQRKERRVDDIFLPQHFDTDQFYKNVDKVADNDLVYVTAKLHGTSIRIANTIVKRKLSWLERLAKRLGVKVKETEYDYVYGSRRVIKDPNDPDQDHFYKQDIWTREGERLRGLLPEGFVVYGELIGWADENTPIQTNYTYGIPQGVCELYVYRVAQINPQGRQVDLSWEQVKEFCNEIGVKHVPEMGRRAGFAIKQEIDRYLDIRFNDHGYQGCPPLNAGLVDEGVCLRVDGLTPYVLKAKSPLFLQHETKLYDKVEKAEAKGEDAKVYDLEAEES